MSHFIAGSRTAALLFGCAGALILLAVTSRRGMAEKAQVDNCLNAKESVCRTVETCTPKGFETNGSCQWNYTIARYYWRF